MSTSNKQPHVTGMHHTAIRVRDFDATLAFYSGVLGLKITLTWGEGDKRAAMLDPGDASYLEVFAGGQDDPKPEGAIIHLAFRTDDVDAAIEAVRAAGMEITVEPKDVIIQGSTVTPVRIAFFKGMDGEIVEFFKSTGDNQL